jgi:predicted nucleotidyltransferase
MKLLSPHVLFKNRQKKHSAVLLQDVQRRCIPVFEKYGIRKAILFGSVLDSRAGTSSEIDLLVLPFPEADYWQCRYELEDAFQCSLDLHGQDMNSWLAQKILARGEVIYEIKEG